MPPRQISGGAPDHQVQILDFFKIVSQFQVNQARNNKGTRDTVLFLFLFCHFKLSAEKHNLQDKILESSF